MGITIVFVSCGIVIMVRQIKEMTLSQLGKLKSISNNIELSIFIPFIMLSAFMSVFAVVGITTMHIQDPAILDPLGGYDLWIGLVSIYSVMIIILIVTFVIRVFFQKEDESK